MLLLTQSICIDLVFRDKIYKLFLQNKMIKFGLIIVLLLVNLSLNGQTTRNKSYNIPALIRVKNDTTKINILLEKLGYKYENINPDSSIYFYTIALTIAQKSPDAKKKTEN